MKHEDAEAAVEHTLRQEIVELKRQCHELKEKLADSDGTLSAIQSGEVDAIVVSTPEGERIFTLKGADEPYRILFEQMNEGALITSEDGIILYCNHSFAELMKVPLETVIGTHFEEYLEPLQKGPLRRIIERSEKGPVRDELMFRASDGTPIPTQLSTSMLIAAGVRTYCMVLADLTERVRAEAELQRSYEEVKGIVEERTRELSESEARYRSIYENSRDAILLFDEQGRIVGANPAARQMFAMTDAEALNMGKDDIVINLPLNRAMVDRTIFNKGRIEMNYRARWGGTFIGETTAARFADADGSLITMLIIRDITDRKKAEAALDESRRRESARRAELEALVDAVPAMIWMSDGRGSVIISNETSGEILHQPPGGGVVVTGDGDLRCFIMFRDDQEVPLEEQPMQEVARTGVPCMETEFELRFSDGRSVWMYGNAVPLKTSDGQNEGAIGAFIDITERKRAEERMARSNDELQQFAYVASHDLQEPLRMVISYLGLLEKRYQAQLDDRGREYISIAVDGGRRMKALIDDLLEYSRVDTQGGDFAPVDMNGVVAKTLKLLEVVLRESGTEVTVGELPTIWGDQTQMIQVVQNLVGNAIKYRGSETPRISITAAPRGKEHVFAVSDNGIGFKMEYADRIFQMFQRLHTREEYPGTGVGLAITKRIVDRHGGRIWVESKEGEGSTFFFSIPKH